MRSVTDYFGCMVFDDKAMRLRLPPEIYEAMKKTIRDGKRLDIAVAKRRRRCDEGVGGRERSHPLHPLVPAHDGHHRREARQLCFTRQGAAPPSWNSPARSWSRAESDASSFPSGGLRATFEARGYTAWDPTSYAFVKDGSLYIPTAFCSYGGEALDLKTPLLRSMEAISRQAVRILKLFGQEYESVKTTVGAEQEYFLIDKAMYDRRKDLRYTGRTLFGAKPPKGQELDDHYFGSIKPRVSAFMNELDEELWKLGVFAKTEHNEVAPAQHELAPVFAVTNIATDHNQLTMEIMQKVARKHGMVCLLHEKPFECVNGSGKHNNWSISTTDGVNLLEPGETPYENAQFLLFLCAVIKAVDDYQDLLRISVASAGNDHRLGANEAPPAIVSMFLGDELSDILEAIENETAYDAREKAVMKVGVHILPRFAKDTTDRNRTSPFAFTGNKFEFRMLGSANSIASANIVLNTVVAQSLKSYADRLESADDFEEALHSLIRKTIKDHKRIIFNGNGYDNEWIAEAERRGLLNLPTTPDCLPYLLKDKNIKLFAEHKVFSRQEIEARYEIYLESYCKNVRIEALTMTDMTNKDILPAVSAYFKTLCDTVKAMGRAGIDPSGSYEQVTAEKLAALSRKIFSAVHGLSQAVDGLSEAGDAARESELIRDRVLPQMNLLREYVDAAESITAEEYWPYPSYGDLLFGVH